MKVGILTYTREYANLGTVMQAYSTLQSVRSTYPDAQVELIDYAPQSPSMKPYLSGISSRSLAMDVTRMTKYRRFFKEHLKFSRAAMRTTNRRKALEFVGRQQYDAIYVGSDTVLELKARHSDELTPFWLDNTVPATKFLAAASSLNVTYEQLSAGQRANIQRAIDTFALLGVRDDATFRLLSQFTPEGDQRLQKIPDPTFSYQIDYAHIENYMAQKHIHFAAPVVCLHLLRHSAWAGKLADLFRKAGYIVASLRPARYADLIFTDLAPFEQMGLYRYFALVVTHRFHDTIFCLKNLTPVLAFPERSTDVTPHAESKIASLLAGFGLEHLSYIAPNGGITPESIFERSPSVLSHFQTARPHLQHRLREHHEHYRSFIENSRILVH